MKKVKTTIRLLNTLFYITVCAINFFSFKKQLLGGGLFSREKSIYEFYFFSKFQVILKQMKPNVEKVYVCVYVYLCMYDLIFYFFSINFTSLKAIWCNFWIENQKRTYWLFFLAFMYFGYLINSVTIFRMTTLAYKHN